MEVKEVKGRGGRVKRVRVIVSGRVQGVFFRAYTKKIAKKWRLSGWVKNRDDGKVEAVFEGPENRVKKMVKWCYQGSPTAEVEDVRATKEEPQDLKEFKIKR